MAIVDDFESIAANMKGELKPKKRCAKCERCGDTGFCSGGERPRHWRVACTCAAGDAWLDDTLF